MKKLRFDLYAAEVRDHNGSRVEIVSLAERDVRAFVDSFNQANAGGRATAVVHPISAAIVIAKPKSRSA